MDLRGPGGGGVLPVKMYWGVLPKFQVRSQKHFVFKGPKLQIFHFHIFGSGISLESKIPSFQCEIADKAEHIRPLQKVTSLKT